MDVSAIWSFNQSIDDLALKSGVNRNRLIDFICDEVPLCGQVGVPSELKAIESVLTGRNLTRRPAYYPSHRTAAYRLLLSLYQANNHRRTYVSVKNEYGARSYLIRTTLPNLIKDQFIRTANPYYKLTAMGLDYVRDMEQRMSLGFKSQAVRRCSISEIRKLLH